MYSTIELDGELKAIYVGGSKGSEILLFQRNVGLVGRFNVPETGADAEMLLQAIKQQCGNCMLKVNSWSLMERTLRKFFHLALKAVNSGTTAVSRQSLLPENLHNSSRRAL